MKQNFLHKQPYYQFSLWMLINHKYSDCFICNAIKETKKWIFLQDWWFSLNWPLVIESLCPCKCGSVCAIAKNPLQAVGETSVRRMYCYYWPAMQSHNLVFKCISFFFSILLEHAVLDPPPKKIHFQVSWRLLVKERSSNIVLQWHNAMQWHNDTNLNPPPMLSVLTSTSVKRFSFSRMRDFF